MTLLPAIAARRGFTQAMWNGMRPAEKASVVNRLFDLELQAVRARGRSLGAAGDGLLPAPDKTPPATLLPAPDKTGAGFLTPPPMTTQAEVDAYAALVAADQKKDDANVAAEREKILRTLPRATVEQAGALALLDRDAARRRAQREGLVAAAQESIKPKPPVTPPPVVPRAPAPSGLIQLAIPAAAVGLAWWLFL